MTEYTKKVPCGGKLFLLKKVAKKFLFKTSPPPGLAGVESESFIERQKGIASASPENSGLVPSLVVIMLCAWLSCK